MELDSNDKILLRRGIEKVSNANEILRFLSDYFRDKYHLTPENQITPDGRIISASTGLHGLSGQEGNGISGDDLSVLQSQMAVHGETTGDTG